MGLAATVLSAGAVQAKEKGVIKHDHLKQEISTNQEDLKILQEIDNVEKEFKHPKSKEILDNKKAYVFITESKLKGIIDYNLNETTLESICNDELEGEFINNEKRDYYVLSRNIKPFQEIEEVYDKSSKRNKDFTLQNYIPPTDYVIFKLEKGNSPYQHIGTFTIVDMKTKEIKKYSFTINSNPKELDIEKQYKEYPQESINAIKNLKLNNADYISKQVIQEFKKITTEL